MFQGFAKKINFGSTVIKYHKVSPIITWFWVEYGYENGSEKKQLSSDKFDPNMQLNKYKQYSIYRCIIFKRQRGSQTNDYLFYRKKKVIAK